MVGPPERRQTQRVALAEPIWLLSWRGIQRATLRDGTAVSLGLAVRGRSPAAGSRAIVLLPGGPDQLLPAPVFARIVRGAGSAGLIFTSIPRSSRLALQALLDREATDTPAGESQGGPRRRAVRRHYSVRLAARSVWLPHVLVARDLSTEGVRVHALPWAAVGSELRISFPVPGAPSPISISARVARHDGDAGTILRFHSVTPEEREGLDGLLALLPELPDGRREGVALAAVENDYDSGAA